MRKHIPKNKVFEVIICRTHWILCKTHPQNSKEGHLKCTQDPLVFYLLYVSFAEIESYTMSSCKAKDKKWLIWHKSQVKFPFAILSNSSNLWKAFLTLSDIMYTCYHTVYLMVFLLLHLDNLLKDNQNVFRAKMISLPNFLLWGFMQWGWWKGPY